MKQRRAVIIVGCTVILGFNPANALDSTIGLNPSDGVNMFVKAFAVSAGTTITGTQFTSNDPETVFPTVVLVRGGTSSLSTGTTVRTATNAGETSSGVVTVTWSSFVTVSESGTYYVGIAPPSGAGKQGAGDGPAIGATRVSSPTGSFVATGEDGDLLAAGVDLSITLLTTGGGSGKATGVPLVARTFLSEPKPTPCNPSTEIEFGVERTAAVRLGIYNVGGRMVRLLVSGTLPVGVHRRVWDGRDDSGQPSAAGVYFIRLAAGQELMQKKLVLVK